MTTRLALLSALLAAACHSSTPPPSPPANTSATPAVPATATDCGTVDTRIGQPAQDPGPPYQCFVDAFHANREATVRWATSTDEGGTILTTYRVIPGPDHALVAVTIDDRDDAFSGNRGIHELTCTGLATAPTTSGGLVLQPVECTGAL